MSDLIPSIGWSDFKKIKEAGRLKDLKSCEVIFNQETIFTVIIYHGDPHTDGYARTQSEYLAVRTNPVGGGKDPDELLAEIEGKAGDDFICPECERSFKIKVALVGHMRTHKVKVLA